MSGFTCKETREMKKALKDLSMSCFIFLRQLDDLMEDRTMPEVERGKRIAALVNALELANDRVRFFRLGVDYRKDDKGKLWSKIKSQFKKEAVK